ncbi:DUF3558 domain-containing protein [Corynebacterium sp. H130]|uniref:DUF3558 domain-containing protein n=1 Tax=Corynebacterium sp. H130 TaxID=3133444 RepID=UPI0030ADCD60
MRQHTAPQTPTLSQAIAITLFTLSLTACTTTGADTAPHRGDEPTTGSADTAPIDVHAPATFDPKDPNFKLFDPCTELSEETFRQAGLGKRSRIGSNANDPYFLCGFQTAPEAPFFGSVSVVMNKVNLETVERNRYVISKDVDSKIPGVYQYRFDETKIHDCSSVAQTTNGQLEVMIGDLDKIATPNEVCDASLEILEKLYPEVEKKINDGIRRH